MKKFVVLLTVLFLFVCISDAEAQGRMKKNPIMLGAELGLSVPMGDFGDAADVGFGLNAFFNYYLMRQLVLMASFGYYSWSIDNVDGSFSDIPLLVGILYEIALQGFILYFGAELGLHFTSASIDYGFHDYSDSETKFGFAPIFGVLFPLTKTLDFRANMKINLIDDGNSFNLHAGVRMRLP